MAEPFSVRLGLEEVVYIMYALQVKQLPGVNIHPIDQFDADHQALALSVADRSLRARLFIYRTSAETRQLDPALAGCFTAYAHPASTLTLTKQRLPDGPIIHIDIAFQPPFAIDHIQIEQGVHQFVTVSGDEDIRKRLLSLIPLKGAPGGGFRCTLSRTTFEVALATSPRVFETVRDSLARELPQSVAHSLAHALTSNTMFYRFTFDERGSNQDATLLAIASSHGLYLLKSNEQQYDVIPRTTHAAEEDIMQWVMSLGTHSHSS